MSGSSYDLIPLGERGLAPRSLGQAVVIAELMMKCGLHGGMEKPERLALALIAGIEVGLTPFQALDSIYVTNGKANIYGDAILGLLLASGKLVKYRDNCEELEASADLPDALTAKVELWRTGFEAPFVGVFSVRDSKEAGLWGKRGSTSGKPSAWVTYPRDQLYRRALGRAADKGFADVLKGLKPRDSDDGIVQAPFIAEKDGPLIFPPQESAVAGKDAAEVASDLEEAAAPHAERERQEPHWLQTDAGAALFGRLRAAAAERAMSPDGAYDWLRRTLPAERAAGKRTVTDLLAAMTREEAEKAVVRLEESAPFDVPAGAGEEVRGA